MVGVTIGLERTTYSVNEEDGQVEVCAVLLSGSLERTVNVTLTSVNGSASGRLELPPAFTILLLTWLLPCLTLHFSTWRLYSDRNHAEL